MRPFSRLATLSLFVAFAAPSTLRAQHAMALVPPTDSTAVISVTPALDSAAPTTVADPAHQTGAPLTGLRAGVHARETARSLQPTVAAPTRANLGQARAMMVVGVAALIAGAIIGGDPGTIIMVGGAVVGLYGLYQYLQ